MAGIGELAGVLASSTGLDKFCSLGLGAAGSGLGAAGTAVCGLGVASAGTGTLRLLGVATKLIPISVSFGLFAGICGVSGIFREDELAGSGEVTAGFMGAAVSGGELAGEIWGGGGAGRIAG